MILPSEGASDFQEIGQITVKQKSTFENVRTKLENKIIQMYVLLLLRI